MGTRGRGEGGGAVSPKSFEGCCEEGLGWKGMEEERVERSFRPWFGGLSEAESGFRSGIVVVWPWVDWPATLGSVVLRTEERRRAAAAAAESVGGAVDGGGGMLFWERRHWEGGWA